MQAKSFDALVNQSLNNSFDTPEVVNKKMTQLASKNEQDLSSMEVPDYFRIPTAEQLTVMRQWAIDYKKAFPKTTKRQLRKATQKHFSIRIFK